MTGGEGEEVSGYIVERQRKRGALRYWDLIHLSFTCVLESLVAFVFGESGRG